jgi:hypothetical protein
MVEGKRLRPACIGLQMAYVKRGRASGGCTWLYRTADAEEIRLPILNPTDFPVSAAGVFPEVRSSYEVKVDGRNEALPSQASASNVC